MDATSALSESLPEALREPLVQGELDFLLKDLGIPPESLCTLLDSDADGQALALATIVSPGHAASDRILEVLRRAADETLREEGALLVFLEGRRPEEQLAAWRNGLWPVLHTNVIYKVEKTRTIRRTLSGDQLVDTAARKVHHVRAGSVMLFRRREHAMGPDATIEKFDMNAAGWNGDPTGPSYPHFRWMRRFVACFTELPKDARLLDFGCGAGWCGIEAAKHFSAAELCFFDPSPEMIKIAERNAKEQGISKAEGRTGFGETPPFPAEGEEPFDAVISSGVISFAPDPSVWLEGLIPTIKPGGTLVIGDIAGTSHGMQRRRREKALLPAREMNAQSAAEVRRLLEARGFEYTGGAGYQLTRPFPEAIHLNEVKLKGLLTYPLLWSNRLAAAANRRLGIPGAGRFDSWVMSFVRS
jgi:2-polyprenyl-3-methyl-5-hydroxy-6-metoxy-1,4-benzoquinol methylase